MPTPRDELSWLRRVLLLPGLVLGCSPEPIASRGVVNQATVADSTITLPPISLGVLAPGRSVCTSASIRNPRSVPIIVDRVETSCECVRVSPRSMHIEPGQAAELTIMFDPSEAPEFRGDLGVEVVGWNESARAAFRAVVSLEVRAVTANRGDRDGR